MGNLVNVGILGVSFYTHFRFVSSSFLTGTRLALVFPIQFGSSFTSVLLNQCSWNKTRWGTPCDCVLEFCVVSQHIKRSVCVRVCDARAFVLQKSGRALSAGHEQILL